MATVINNPNTADTDTGGWSVAIIILAIIVLGVLAFFAFGRGYLGGGAGTTQINIPAASPSGSGGVSGGTTGGSAGADGASSGSSGASGY